MASQIELAPCGTNPPSSARLAKPVASVSGSPKKTSSAAHRMKAQSATTLTVESQNSVVPKDFTLMMLTARTIAAIARIATDIGTSGHHHRMYSAEATTSVPMTTTALNQYSHRLRNPAHGPR